VWASAYPEGRPGAGTADGGVLKTPVLRDVWVRVPPRAPVLVETMGAAFSATCASELPAEGPTRVRLATYLCSTLVLGMSVSV
jgi:hypothetical protein